MMIIFKAMLLLSLVAYLTYLINFVIAATGSLKRVKPVINFEKTYRLFLVIPVLNEEAVIGSTIKSLLVACKKLPDYIDPTIIAVNDNSDDDSRSIIELLQKQTNNLWLLNREPANSRNGKGAVINDAIRMVGGNQYLDPQRTIIGVIDADSRISTSSLTTVISYFIANMETDMVQGKVKVYNDEQTLPRMQDFEFMGMNSVLQKARQLYGQGIASGNGQFVTLRLARKNPWGNSLLEDLEFTLRAWLKGFKTAFCNEVVVYQSGVERVRPLIRQRTRWCQGSLQCWRYILPLWRNHQVSFFSKLDTTLWMLTPIVSVFLPITNLLAIVVQLFNWWLAAPSGWTSPSLTAIIILNITVEFFLAMFYYESIVVIKNKRITYLKSLWLSVLYQWYLILLVPVPYIAVTRQLLGLHNWEKTKHEINPSDGDV